MTDRLIEELKARVVSGKRLTMLGVADMPKPFQPATKTEIAHAEQRLGVHFPTIFRRVYGEVGNGGFGPGYGMIGLITGHQDEGSIISHYEFDTGVLWENWRWPHGRVRLAHWGCSIWSCVDLTTEAAPVLRFDPNGFIESSEDTRDEGLEPSESLEQFFVAEKDGFGDWLSDWLNGTLKF